jgi:hyperosmotically inducible periplasmic protein
MKFKIAVASLLLFTFTAVCLAKDAVSDDMIYNNVRIKLASDAVVKGGALDVDVKQGVVTLSGSVEMPKQRDRAAKLAKGIKGVKQVINNITIRTKNVGP